MAANHCGVFVSNNPYIRGSCLTHDIVKEHLAKAISMPLSFVNLRWKSGYKSFEEALSTPDQKTNLPPPVSKLSSRFEVTCDHPFELQFGNIFTNPELDNPDDNFIQALKEAIVSLCSVAWIHHEKVLNPTSTKGKESVTDESLCISILQTLLPSPFVLRSQLETRILAWSSPVKLPSAKFDIVVTDLDSDGSHGDGDASNDHVIDDAPHVTDDAPHVTDDAPHVTDDAPYIAKKLVSLALGSNESVKEIVSAKTDTSIHPNSTIVQVVFEAMIFSELHTKDVVPVICASKSYVQVLIRIKSKDILICSPIVEWSNLVDGSGYFQYPECILMILFIKEGAPVFPMFDREFICKVLEKANCKPLGWNAVHSTIKDEYSRELIQTKPNPNTRQHRRKMKHRQEASYLTKNDLMSRLGKHERQSSSDTTSSLSPQK